MAGFTLRSRALIMKFNACGLVWLGNNAEIYQSKWVVERVMICEKHFGMT